MKKKDGWCICSSSNDLYDFVLEMKGITNTDYFSRHLKFDGELAKTLMPVMVAFDKNRNDNLFDYGAKFLRTIFSASKWQDVTGLFVVPLKQIFFDENGDLLKREAAKHRVPSQIIEDILYLGHQYRYEIGGVNPTKGEITLLLPIAHGPL